MEKVILVLCIGLLTLTACFPKTTAEPVTKQLKFTASCYTLPSETIEIVLGLQTAEQAVPADPQFMGQFMLTDKNDSILSSGEIIPMPALEAETEREMLRITTELEAGNYTLTWGAPNYGGLTMEFTVELTSSGTKDIRINRSYPNEAFFLTTVEAEQ